jgi:BirA family transcriptional regulator, biotin operon repressor / biotin---[acetyl-CoA-carboxylase] ligase
MTSKASIPFNRFSLFGAEILKLDVVDSTNNYTANAYAEGKIKNGTVILAEHQVLGKGQRGNTWLSESGKNLLCSFLYCPDNLSVFHQVALTWATSLAVLQTLDYFNIQSNIKWPNDIYVGKQKIAGILIENQLSGQKIERAILGIGLNVNQNVFPNLQATSISIELGRDILVLEVLEVLIQKMNEQFIHILNQEFSILKNNYLKNLYQLNQVAKYKDDNGQFEGEILGITEKGALLLNRAGVITEYGVKEIVYC